ncbi:hypothetical protein WKR88_10000 [Trinickia caryophylli]|uniref:Uncharacterized protein n=1 Tax=Trinickia caryophylli TaxID=28094 RepID=A0A1X7ERK6_TRICW|nr:hypothetical protein [Trinickia caryophylli]PMS12064.1 hypothetical protein C0Z17_10790 [Trinickia caryophylli]TRX18631.1 hypothetical protein FNF07_10640 [Trinickia caryophylli]WQE10577.1 hypothetical protein U0034_12290 [Trinickia caryophylli]SMF38777.1 hypothetical protein SAMN06295900_106193 [Trinickia caryophylli]GLU32939.1 hypothetical protein Busp01_27810 [Trinickia caryophylli]
MRLISAALLGVAASWPALVHATTTTPDPADATGPVPAIAAPLAFDGYRPYDESGNRSWQELNQAVQDKPFKGGAPHDGAMSKPTAGGKSNHSQHGETHR